MFSIFRMPSKGRCEKPNPIGKRILIINLDAMGAVVQTTSMLKAIKRKFPQSTISWITLKTQFGFWTTIHF